MPELTYEYLKKGWDLAPSLGLAAFWFLVMLLYGLGDPAVFGMWHMYAVPAVVFLLNVLICKISGAGKYERIISYNDRALCQYCGEKRGGDLCRKCGAPKYA